MDCTMENSYVKRPAWEVDPEVIAAREAGRSSFDEFCEAAKEHLALLYDRPATWWYLMYLNARFELERLLCFASEMLRRD